MFWLEEKYLLLLSNRLRNFAEKRRDPSLYQFSCPFCGDSESDPNKARGYLYEKNGEGKYKCHNCGETRSKFVWFLRDVDADLYKAFQMDSLGRSQPSKERENAPVTSSKTPEKNKRDPSEVLFPLTQKERKYLLDRKVEVDSRMHHLQSTSDLGPFSLDPETRFPYGPRIALEVRNAEAELVGFSCRTIDSREKLRYVNVKLRDEPLVFNSELVDREKLFFAVEGVFDCLHLRNAVAVAGSDLAKVTEKNAVFVFDNQPRNAEILKKMSSCIDRGSRVVVWPRYAERFGKDLNEMVNSGLREDELAALLEENVCSGFEARMRFDRWRRV